MIVGHTQSGENSSPNLSNILPPSPFTFNCHISIFKSQLINFKIKLNILKLTLNIKLKSRN